MADIICVVHSVVHLLYFRTSTLLHYFQSHICTVNIKAFFSPEIFSKHFIIFI